MLNDDIFLSILTSFEIINVWISVGCESEPGKNKQQKALLSKSIFLHVFKFMRFVLFFFSSSLSLQIQESNLARTVWGMKCNQGATLAVVETTLNCHKL